MSKNPRKIDKGVSSQLSLIDSDLSEGSFDIGLGIKQTLSLQLRGHDRWMVAAQIGRATGKEVSKETLDKILSSDPAYQPTLLQGTVICALTKSLQVFQYCLEPLGSDVLDPADRDLIQLARLMEKQKQIETEIMTLRARRGLK